MSKELDMLKEVVRMMEEKEDKQVVDAPDDGGKVELSTLKPGEVFKIGEHDFIVLEQKNGETVVISKGLMIKDVPFDKESRDYRKSSLKERIEKEIQPIIEAAVGADNIVEHEVNLTSIDGQNEFGTCTCKVRVVNFNEARKYNSLIADKSLPDWWWTCTPWSTEDRGWDYSMAVVSPAGYVNYDECDDYDGVRPFCILKSNIFVSKGEQ